MSPKGTSNPGKWKIGESVLRVLIGGRSFLDSKDGFIGTFRNVHGAENYLGAYGFNLHDPIEKAELQGSLQEAIRFIRSYFLKPGNPEGLALEIPKKIIETKTIPELLLFASSESQTELRLWACAILRVIHTLSHVDRDIRTHYFTDIQTQILDRFYRQLHRDEHGELYLGRTLDDPYRVDLVRFEVKPKKARDSILMKLLHKPESVAEELFDRVGVRFVTKNRTDAVRVIQYLEHANVVVSANIKPSRSRNTLILVDEFEAILKGALPQLKSGALSEAELRQKLEACAYPESNAGENPFSSEHYRAIQFTCRQLIKIKNPLSDHIRDLKSVARGKNLDPDLAAAIEKVDQKYIQRVARFFYPFEIQVMDEKSHIENEKGRSAHGEYKKAQQRAAMSRVMGALAQNEA
ncbi:MAG: TIGR04552 family protein [Bdellovibrionales bacterium]|nr:TIGR04552 family protein [Bdellovibrionales bacterium]